MSLKRELKFFENYKITSKAIDNLIFKDSLHLLYKNSEIEHRWIEKSSFLLRDYTDIIKSTYIRWALCVNGLNLGFEKYSKEDFKDKAFVIQSTRFVDSVYTNVNIMAWDGDTSAKNHIETVNMLASYAIIDLYSLLEELVLKLFRTYWFYNPEEMIKGRENRNLRILYRDKEDNTERWENAWNERLDNWQRKKIYEGIGKIFTSYFSTCRLKTPKENDEFTLDNISKTLKGISVLRNCLVHGTSIVTKELEVVSNLDKINEFSFKEGDKIELTLEHLKSIEQFTNAFIAYLNIVLMERLIFK